MNHNTPARHRPVPRRTIFTHETQFPCPSDSSIVYNIFIEYVAFPDSNNIYVDDFSITDQSGAEVIDPLTRTTIQNLLIRYTDQNHHSLMEHAI